jgi:hypothetical protein
MSVEVTNVKIIVLNSKTLYYDRYTLFSNPEGFDFNIAYYRQGEDPLPYFMRDDGNGSLIIKSLNNDDIG